MWVRKVVGSLTISLVAALSTGCASTVVPPVTVTAAQPSVPSTLSSAPAPTISASNVGASPTATTGSTVSSGATSRTDPNAPAGQCADNHLAVSVQNDPTGSGAGQRLSYVVFRNTGSSTCVLRGAPGVSLVGDGNGTQIGAAATRSPGGPAVTIPAGSYALADLTYPNIDENGGAYGDGEVTTRSARRRPPTATASTHPTASAPTSAPTRPTDAARRCGPSESGP